MKTKMLLCLGVIALAGWAGCSTRVPRVVYHHGLYQKKVQALKHWDRMAQEVVEKTLADARFANRAIAVHEPEDATVFVKTVNQMIKTELLNRQALNEGGGSGVPTIHVETHLLRHPGKRYTINPSHLIAAVVAGTVQIVTGGVFGTPRETTSELLAISLVKEGETAKLGVKQIVYVDRDEDVAFYLQPAKIATNNLKVTTTP